MFLGGSDQSTEQPSSPAARPETHELDVTAVPTEELAELVLEAELATRRQHADYLELLAETDRRRCARDSIHRSTSIWLADQQHARTSTSTKSLHLGRLIFEHHPELGRRYREGQLNPDHLGLFTRLWNRRELRGALARDFDHLLGWTTKPWNECAALFRTWEELVDPTDPNDEARRAHNRRGFTYARLGHDILGELNTTTAFMAAIEAGLRAKVDQLFEQDWAEARARVGETACADDLDRNDTQRWHDAMITLLRQGIGADPATTNAVVNIVTDDDTIEFEAEQRDADAVGQPVGPRDTSDSVSRAPRRRCETESGAPIAPADALDFALAGHVRLFRMNADTGDFTASARTRLFTGSKRLGIMIRDRYCQGPGCNNHSIRCQADHSIRHIDGGPTIPTNGKARCGPCHRHKTRLETLGLWPPG